MIIHLPTIAFDVIILRFPFCDLKGFPGNDDVGGTGPAGTIFGSRCSGICEWGRGLVWLGGTGKERKGNEIREGGRRE